jgi:hypothetical protein
MKPDGIDFNQNPVFAPYRTRRACLTISLWCGFSDGDTLPV